MLYDFKGSNFWKYNYVWKYSDLCFQTLGSDYKCWHFQKLNLSKICHCMVVTAAVVYVTTDM